MLPQNIFVTLKQIILYGVAVSKRVALHLHCVALATTRDISDTTSLD